MTIKEAISQLDAMKFNTYSDSDKVDWLSRADWMVKKHIIDKHEGGESVAFSGYDENTDTETTELLVPPPYDELYLRWMAAQIDFYNREYNDYNNAIALFNTNFAAYSEHYTQAHRPLAGGRRFLF